jgi:5-methylthioadenosine/S-adenosylhomocysteine deaminase
MITIVNSIVVTMDSQRRVIRDGAVTIEDDRIRDVGSTEEIKARYGELDQVIDGRGMIVCPGFVNAHTHMFQCLLRGLGDDLELHDWLVHAIRPITGLLEDDDLYYATLISGIEMVKTGSTSVIDNHTQNTSETGVDSIVKGLAEVGMRGLVARGMKDKASPDTKHGPREALPYTIDEDCRLTVRLIEKWNKENNGLIRVCPGPVAVASCSPELFIQSKEIADKYDVPLHTHIAETDRRVRICREEYGKGEIEHLDSLGIISPRFQSVHSVWINEREIKTLAERKANMVHCPVSNMYLSAGVASVPRMLKEGVNVALGTDGPASNNNQDMLAVLKATALLHKVTSGNAGVITCEQVLEMATLGGTRALGLREHLGAIEPGKKADVIMVNLHKATCVPVHKPISSLVYSALSGDVDTSIIDGKLVMRQGKILTVDEETVLREGQEVGDDLMTRAKLQPMGRWPIV